MYTTGKIVQRITYWSVYFFLRLFWDYRVEGRENLNGLENGGVIFASNHGSFFDGPICGTAMPWNNKIYSNNFLPIRFLAWRKYYNWLNPFPFPLNFLVALYIRINGSLPIDKAGGDLFKALADVIDALKKGNKVWIYPEGGVTKDGNLQPGKRGVAFLHQQTGAPIVPVALLGTFKMFSLKNIFGAGKIKVKIGKPINSLEGLSLEEGVNLVMQKIKELLIY